MRVSLDTNVLLAALISPYGSPDTIYRSWRAGRFELVTSITQLDELRRASRYPKLKAILPAHRVGTMINNMQRAIVLEYWPSKPFEGLEKAREWVDGFVTWYNEEHRHSGIRFVSKRPMKSVLTFAA